jgi:hypothetical protein
MNQGLPYTAEDYVPGTTLTREQHERAEEAALQGPERAFQELDRETLEDLYMLSLTRIGELEEAGEEVVNVWYKTASQFKSPFDDVIRKLERVLNS